MIRRIVSSAVLASALVAAPLLVAAPAQSIPLCKAGYQCERTYYSDNTFDTVVGQNVRFCDGSIEVWGTTTRWLITSQIQCQSDA
jgi:hypothetical protein